MRECIITPNTEEERRTNEGAGSLTLGELLAVANRDVIMQVLAPGTTARVISHLVLPSIPLLLMGWGSRFPAMSLLVL